MGGSKWDWIGIIIIFAAICAALGAGGYALAGWLFDHVRIIWQK